MSFMEAVFAPYAERAAELTSSANPFAQGIAWIEGAFVPLAQARIPLLDQGFLHSDLTYDVPAVWNGRFFRLDDHMDRLEASCEKMRLKLPISREDMRATLIEMVARSGIRDAYVEMIVTRGLKFVRGHKPEDIVNSLYMLVMPYVWVMSPELQRVGGSAIITRTVRRVPPGAIDPTVKNLQWGDFVRGLFEAQDRDAIYPILPDGDGNITEGSGFNVVLIKDGVLYTPERGVLEGVTRKTVFEIARKQGIEVRLEHVPVDLAYRCDELFFCTTAGGIMPITRLDDQPVGGGQVGPMTRRIWEEYWSLHDDPAYSFAVPYPDS
ncbi:class IV aminotransferase [Rhizobium sp. CG5]|uniref:aminotransferase class IV n=1 Tax=Rhizobium sp. CG5 TaxID=2726076 RepID=UPI0020332B6E|nr:aminotransferase class IV [Rhizobium sp. CG5]MCM2476354.1 class IV aminotransferase [Rhizobium sp. CG5]